MISLSKGHDMKTWIPCAVLSALAILSVAPFAARAVYLDEHLYLHIAETAVNKNWMFPLDTPWIFFGIHGANLALVTHPPAGSYFLALMLRFWGHFDETYFRLAWGIFPVIAVLSFYRLARHFTASPLLVSLLFAASPAFFVLSPTLMMDLPMLAFFLLGLGFYLDCLQGRARLLPASVCFILSAGTGYSALIPIGCLFIWAIAQRRPKQELFAISAAPAAVLVWSAAMRIHFGEIPEIKLAQYFLTHSSSLQDLLPTFSFLGGVSLVPWGFFALVDVPKKRWVAVSSLSAAIILSVFHAWPSLLSRLWFILLASSGVGLLIAFALKYPQRDSSDRSFGRGILFIWLPATLLFFMLAGEMVNARYILHSLPPLFLVAFSRVHRTAAISTLAATLLLSSILSIEDYRFVNSYREWVTKVIIPLQQQGFRIWSATESGLRFYLEQRGIQTLDNTDIRPRGGDLIVRQASFHYGLSKDLEPLLISIAEKDLMEPFPIRTFARAAGAGFYDSHFGIVPFSFSHVPLDHLELAQVSPFVSDLPQVVPADFSSVPVWFPGGVLLKQTQPEMKFRIRIPRDTKAEYELDGEGSVELLSDGITLKKTSPGPAVWKNFRIIPRAWAANE